MKTKMYFKLRLDLDLAREVHHRHPSRGRLARRWIRTIGDAITSPPVLREMQEWAAQLPDTPAAKIVGIKISRGPVSLSYTPSKVSMEKTT